MLVGFFFACLQIGAKDIEWFDGTNATTYHIIGETSPVVGIAVKMWAGDILQVTGKSPVESKDATIEIVQLDKAIKNEKSRLRQLGIPVESLSEKTDGFYLGNDGTHIVIAGANGRGTAYGILELSRQAGVSPWVWWSNVAPVKRQKLIMKDGFHTLQGASVKYRGIFINDEDWSLQPWSWNKFEKGIKKGQIGPKTYKEIFKLLLRLRANAVWPGMHGITTPFYLIPGAKEIADSCGIVIGTSHCEPLMRNNVGEWDIKERGRYNYITNKNAVLNYWTERLKEVNNFENMYTIGMRGMHDGSMEGVKTLDEKTKALQRVIIDQRELLKTYVNSDVTKIPQVFVPYKEVLDIMEHGLDVPEDVTLMWCDDNYGYMTRLSDEIQQKRPGGGGVYYHLSYWGRPHDYMWLTTTQPGLIYNEMREAYDHNARRVWIVNVHDLKPSAYDLELFLDMAWNIQAIQPSTINRHLENWLSREFGENAGRQLAPVMEEYYRLCSIRKPELMGWSQVELDKRKYNGGCSPVQDTEFSFTEMGDEADRYLYAYQSIRQSVLDIEKTIPPTLRDAYFSHIKYQTLGAADMAVKMLEAQRARNSKDAATIAESANKSMAAYQDIKALTHDYNNNMAAGFWEYSMTDDPRGLNVFQAPNLPVKPDGKSSVWNYKSFKDFAANSVVAMNASDYTSASDDIQQVQMLGHSMNAVRLPKDAQLSYSFETLMGGDALLTIAVIPTQPSDKGDIRLGISIDGGEVKSLSFRENGRTDTWKENVMRNQALIKIPVTLTKGKHTLNIKAMDNHIVVDQWMIDFQKDRKFYVIPVRK